MCNQQNPTFSQRYPDGIVVPDPNYKIQYDADGRVLSAPAHATYESFEAHCAQRKPVGSCECDAYAYHECVCDIQAELMTDDSYSPQREDMPNYVY